MPDVMPGAMPQAMPGECPEQSTYLRTDVLTNVLPPKATSSPSQTRASARQSISLSAHCIDPKHPDCHWTRHEWEASAPKRPQLPASSVGGVTSRETRDE